MCRSFEAHTNIFSLEPDTSIRSFFRTRKKLPGFSWSVIKVERKGSTRDGNISWRRKHDTKRFNVSASCKCIARVSSQAAEYTCSCSVIYKRVVSSSLHRELPNLQYAEESCRTTSSSASVDATW